MEIRLFFQMLRRGWWVVLVTVFAALAVSLWVSYTTVPQYRAVARFVISPSNVLQSGNEIVQSLNTLDKQSVMITYAEIMNSSRVYNDALTSLQLKPKDTSLYTSHAEVFPNSSVLELNVSGPDPQLAARLANAIGVQAINFNRNLNQVFTVDFLDTAVPPNIPFNPMPLRDSGLAVIFGLIGGVVLVFLHEQILVSWDALVQSLHLDHDTGVYTRRYFTSLVEHELARNPDEKLTVVIVELDGLRDLVEAFPGVGAQKALQAVRDILHKELRGNDVIGRWNDVSFIMMLPKTRASAGFRIFERIFKTLSQPVDLGDMGMLDNLVAHVGGAEYSNRVPAAELFAQADKALEYAKQEENPVYIWNANSQILAHGKVTA